MKLNFVVPAILVVSSFCPAGETGLVANEENGHYLQWRGKTTVLVGSTEHYGAVLNSEFDYVKYLDTLQRDGLNVTRTFSGAYCEPGNAFGIKGNTLAPGDGKLLCPWPRSDVPGYKGGGNKFDLSKWNDAYFTRLKDFLTRAGERGIVVEFVLFCPFYEDSMWERSPLHPDNNINGTPKAARTEVWALKHEALTDYQDKLIRKFAAELNAFDNFYWEICNEPYFGNVTPKFQRFVADTLTAAEQDMPRKHLIAQNIANKKAQIKDPVPSAKIFNFHYATPPDTVGQNYQLNRVIGDDETGFKGIADFTYRREAWEFIVAGGGIFDHLDYSFTVGHETGDFVIPDKQPGGGGTKLRASLKVLKDFMLGFDIAKLVPDNVTLKGVEPTTVAARCISQPGVSYGIYLAGGKKATLSLALAPGNYSVEWIDTLSGKVTAATLAHQSGVAQLASPDYEEDAAVRIVKKN